jgi:MATE family multidrug resistance protein
MEYKKIARGGDSLKSIFFYWWPEVISAAILTTLPLIIDSLIVASSQSLSTFGALGVTSNILALLTKLAEAVPVASIAFIGRFNGSKEFSRCGEYLYNTFWITFVLGISQFLIILFGARSIFTWLEASPKMVEIAIPFIQLKSLGIILIFSVMVFIGFMRAVKNTYMPMILYVSGVLAFIFFDYALVLGRCGFPEMGLMGSAVATIIQYSIMNILALTYIFLNKDYRKYFPSFIKSLFDKFKIGQILWLSWPIVIDKTTISLSYIWLAKMIYPMGKYATVSYNAIRNIEFFAFIPAVAAAQVITFLVSNRLGAKDPDGAISNIRKVLFLSAITFIPIIIIFSIFAPSIIGIFDPKNKYTEFAIYTFLAINVLAIFDALQVVLAGALRGAGDVQTVMWVRFGFCFGFFVPLSYLIKSMNIENTSLKFTLIYSSFFVATGLISYFYYRRLKGNLWKSIDINSEK